MGSFGTGFLGAFGDAVHQKAQRQHALEVEAKQREAQYHWNALQDAINRGGYMGTNPETNKREFIPFTQQNYKEMLDNTIGHVQKAYGGSKTMKDIFTRTHNMVGAMMGHPDFHARDEPRGGTQATQADAAPKASPNLGIPAPPTSITPSSASDVPRDTSQTAAAKFPFPGDQGATTPSVGGTSDQADPTAVAAAATPKNTPLIPPPPPSTTPDPLAAQDQQTIASGALADQDQAKIDKANLADQAAQAAAAPPAPVMKPVIPPAPAMTGDQLINSRISPIDQAQIANDVQLQMGQKQFEQQQAQASARQKVIEQSIGRPLNADESLMLHGVKMPAGYLNPHYNSKLVTGDNLPQNYVMVDGTKADPGKIYQQVMVRNGSPIFSPVSVPYHIETDGNLHHAINSYTGEDMGAINELPVRVPTNTSNLAATTVIVDGKPVQLPGSRSNSPATYAAPSIMARHAAAGAVPPPPVTPLVNSGSAPVTSGGKPTKAGKAAAAQVLQAGGNPQTKPSGATPLPSGSRVLPGVPPNMLNVQKRNTAINVAGQALEQFSKPQESGFSNLDVFKDKNGVSRIADYLRINNALMEGEFNSAEKGGAEGSLSFMMGIPQSYMHQQNKAAQDKFASLTPAEKRFVSDYYYMIGNWGAMRAATGANASQWSFKNLAQEIPNPMTMNSYTEAKRKVVDLLGEFKQVASPNLDIKSYNEKDLFPAQGQVPAPPMSKSGSGKTFDVPAGNKIWHFSTKEAADRFKKDAGIQ